MTEPPGNRLPGRALAWLVTGPLGRGASFAVDFLAAARTMFARRFL